MYKVKFIRKIFIAIIIILIANHPLSAQQNEYADTQFKLAVEQYQSGEFKDALPLFRKIAIQLPYNHFTTAAYIFIGKTFLQMNDLDSAKKYLQSFLNKYPLSEYTGEASLALVDVFYKQENYKKSFDCILNLIADANSSDYKKYASSTGEKLAINYLSLKDIQNYSDTTSSSSLKPYLLLLIGEKKQSAGDYNLASNTYEQLIDTYPGSEQAETAEHLIKQIENKKGEAAAKNLLAVLLPLNNDKTGEKITAAEEILEGIKYAVSKYNLNHEIKIGLVIRDTGDDSIKINVIKNEINSIPSVIAILGPIFSNEVRFTLQDFKNSGIPIISPTATDNDLVDLSEYFYQANPSFSMRGKVMAQYMYYVAGIKNIAVLKAAQNYSPELADGFADEFEKIGGKIVVTGTYSSGLFDHIEPLSTIAADSEKLEGIYLPLSNKIDAAPLLSQMVQNGINKPIFGNQDWFYAKGFESSTDLSSRLSFTSDFFIDYNDTSFNSFSTDFVKQTGIDINRNILYGYDTANYLLTLISDGAETRTSMINAMESGIEVKGYHNNIAFGTKHINRFLNIVRYNDGKFELVDRFKSDE